MRAIITGVFLLCLPCEAQRATELYVPIGKSPGLSREGKTIMGTVTKTTGGEITIGDKVIRVNDETKYFLDRSAVRKPNTYGSRGDLQVGTLVEAYAPDGDSVWVKLKTR